MCAREATVSASDHDLVALARAGDREAFTALVQMYGRDVQRLCTVITTDASLAEDAAQNAWHRVWRQRFATLLACVPGC